jgi:NAD(P)H-dependent FMN reductase
MSKSKIGIILSTTREGRFGDTVAAWIAPIAKQNAALDFEIVDLRDYPLPFFDEPRSPAYHASE